MLMDGNTQAATVYDPDLIERLVELLNEYEALKEEIKE